MTNICKFKEQINENKHLYLAYIIIFSIILTPDIRIASLPALRIEQLIIILLTLNIFLRFVQNKKIILKKDKFVLIHSSFSIFIVLSICVGSIKGVNVIVNDFFEIYKIYIYIGIYLIISSTIKSKEDKIKIIKFILICIIISVVISIQQYYNLFNLNEKYIHIIAPTQYKTLVNNYPNPRVVGMTGNPNVYAVMPGIGAILSWLIYLTTRKKRMLIFLAIYILGVLITFSRSGFVFMSIGIIMYTFLYFINNIFKTKGLFSLKINLKFFGFFLTVLILLLFFILIIFNNLPKELTWRLLRGLNLSTDSSFQARLSNWKEHIDYFRMSPIFGLGPAKSINYEHFADSEWLLLLRRYGIIGTLYFMMSFIIPFIKSKDKYYKHIYFSVLIASSAYMLVVNIYNSFQLMPLIIILAALVTKKAFNENENFS